MENLKNLRKEKGLSQAQMAKIFEMSLRGYQDIENGVHETSYANLIKFADFFGCSVDFLLDHQTQGILHLDSFSPLQQKVVLMTQKLSGDNLLFIAGQMAKSTNTSIDDILKED